MMAKAINASPATPPIAMPTIAPILKGRCVGSVEERRDTSHEDAAVLEQESNGTAAPEEGTARQPLVMSRCALMTLIVLDELSSVQNR